MSGTPPAPAPASDLPKRAAVGLAMAVVAIVALVLGGVAFWLLVAVVGLITMAEWADLHGATPRDKRLGQYALAVPLAILCPWAAGPGFLALGLVAAAGFFLVIVTGNRGLALGAIYVGLPVLALLLIRAQPAGVLYALWAMGLVIATDTGAYFAGRTFGGPKLAPRLSPKKTWSGLIGGMAAATLFAVALYAGYGLPLRLLVATPLLAVVAQAGDLYESGLKRRAGVKDSGTILPGHGGLMDRIDGLVAVAPVAALLVILPSLIAQA